jgi:hypothetical protein
MSVNTLAILPHQWATFSPKVMDEIANAVCPNGSSLEWKLISESGSAEEDILKFGLVIFRLSGGVTLSIGRKILGFESDDRWLTVLTQKDVREEFISLCERIARVVDARESLIVPEGTVLQDSFYEALSFKEVKQSALQQWGLPDLELSHIYTEDEIRQLGYQRVHYFLIPIELNVLGQQ